jgi:hypothetical protein
LVRFTVSVADRGTANWTTHDVGATLDVPNFPGATNPSDFSVGFGTLAGPVTPGNDGQVSGQFIAPSTPGTYRVVGSMTQKGGGPFGDVITNTLIVTCDHLRVGQRPTTSLPGVPINPAVTVEVADSSNNLVPTATGAIQAALNQTNGAVLGGTTTQSVIGGIASFPDLTVNLPGTYSLTFSGLGLPSVTSDSFTITAPPASCSAGGSAGPSCQATAPGTSGSVVSSAVGGTFEVIDITSGTPGTVVLSGVTSPTPVSFTTIPTHVYMLVAGPFTTMTLS